MYLISFLFSIFYLRFKFEIIKNISEISLNIARSLSISHSLFLIRGGFLFLHYHLILLNFLFLFLFLNHLLIIVTILSNFLLSWLLLLTLLFYLLWLFSFFVFCGCLLGDGLLFFLSAITLIKKENFLEDGALPGEFRDDSGLIGRIAAQQVFAECLADLGTFASVFSCEET